MSSDKRVLKAFVRWDAQGRVVAGSLIFRKNKPTVGKWQEVIMYKHDLYTTTSTTTTTIAPTTTTTTTL